MTRPEPRLIRSARDAEQVACDWMHYWGFRDAKLTNLGADEGVDVVSREAVAQVKAEVRPIGRAVLQSLAGVAATEQKEGLFFALAGYTDEAREWAEKSGLALFQFHLSGEPEPVNAAGRRIAGDDRSKPRERYDDTRSGAPQPARALRGPWAQPLPRQDFWAPAQQEGEYVDPKRLASTLLQVCVEEGKTIAGRHPRLWTPNHRYLWSISLDYLDDETTSGQLEIYHLRLPEWRAKPLPGPLPKNMTVYEGFAEPYDDRDDQYLDPEAARRARASHEQLVEDATDFGMVLQYGPGTRDEVVPQIAADLCSILLTLGERIEASQFEIRDFEWEQQQGEARHRAADQQYQEYTHGVVGSRVDYFRVELQKVPWTRQNKVAKILRKTAGYKWMEATELSQKAPIVLPDLFDVDTATQMTSQINQAGAQATYESTVYPDS